MSVRPSGTAIFGRGSATDPRGISASGGFDSGKLEEDYGRNSGAFCSDHKDEPRSLDAWVKALVKAFLKSDTKFALYLSRSIHCCRGRRSSASTALFPIPVPFVDAWLSRPQRLGRNRRERRAVRQVVHLVVMALNYAYLSAPFSTLPSLRRCPSRIHFGVFRRIEALVRAGGPTGIFSALGCGRKSFQLDARLDELLEALRSLGLGDGSRYCRETGAVDVPVVNDKDELRPYRALDPSRLKLTGEAQWDCRAFLSDLLFMPFVEPLINTFDVEPPLEFCPDFSTISEDLVVDLCKVWDVRGLLKIFPRSFGPETEVGCTKVFNNFKSASTDRQIGDRRSQNFREGRIQGPSASLPTGSALLALAPLRYCEQLIGCVADRRDFYHQFQVTDERAVTNCLYPTVPLAKLIETRAAAVFHQQFVANKKAKSREEHGDFLHGPPVSLWADEGAKVCVAFASIFQGDHLGVEIATDAHSRLLAEHGLLNHGSRLLSGGAIWEDRCVSGLVIDDFFCISSERTSTPRDEAASVLQFVTAKQVYKEEGLVGSDDKDIIGEDRFKVVGAEVVSDIPTVRRGAVVVGAPFQKRLGLGLVSALVAQSRRTSDALHATLVGSWISVLTFRRPAMALVNELFKVVHPSMLDTAQPVLHRLSHDAAEELQLLAALAPVLASNVALPFSPTVYATDASSLKGGIAEANVPEELAKILWRTADHKGANLPLLSKPAAVLYEHDRDYEPDFSEYQDKPEASDAQHAAIPRPIGLRFQFLEICGGAGKVTQKLVKLSVVCGPVFDLSHSKHFNLADSRVLQWIIFMLESDRLDSFLVSPPCTTFSPAAPPCVRSYKIPRGFKQDLFKVWLGNKLAFAAITLLFVALRLHKLGMGEQPRRSKMRWLAEWLRLLAMGAEESFVASCYFGSPHQKEFCFVGVHMHMRLLSRRCTRDHQHVVIQGRYTKPSATYTDQLAEHLAQFFYDHLTAVQRTRRRLDLDVGGLESVLSNDVLQGLQWEAKDSWKWKGASHINLLETSATLKLYRCLALEGGDSRFVYFGDSHVSRSALARGRTSSLALRPMLKRAAVLCLGFGLYPAGRFAPTRLNPADAPSRDGEIEEAVQHMIARSLSPAEASALALLPPLKKWAANWCRLVCLLSPATVFLLSIPSEVRSNASFPTQDSEWTMDFDSTLGFPGEGPQPFGFSLFWIFLFTSWLSCATVGNPRGASHGDAARMKARAGVILEDGRKVTQTTNLTREKLFEKFCSWLLERGLSIEQLLFTNAVDIDQLNKILCEYGRWLFSSGKPYYHYSETLNSVSSRKPAVRRVIQQAWDLAAMWGAHEPTTHHTAMPFQILIAIISIAFCWGWSREAAIFSLAWGAMLRIGEVFNATRADLITPADVGGSIDYVMLRIWEPKTRFRAARHQMSKMEQPDLIEVVRIGLGDLRADERLWPYSGPTLRLRLTKILSRLGLPIKGGGKPQALSLASLRPGGATWLITQTESAELVRRRGRWVSYKVMECYLQEVTYMTYLNEIDPGAKKFILQALRAFPSLLKAIIKFKSCKIPENTWFLLLSKSPD